jgi:branched-chain amino acid transport system substrate-binding protein
VNQRGGIQVGRASYPVVLHYIDDESNPEGTAVWLPDALAARPWDFVLGPYSSAVTLAIAPILETNSIVQISGSAEADEILDYGFEWTFGVLLGNLADVGAPLETIQRIRPDLREAAIIQAGDDVFARCIANAFRKEADKLGLKTQMHDMSPEDPLAPFRVIRRLKHDGLRAVIVGGHVDTLIDTVRVSKALDYVPEAYVMHYGVASHDFISALGEDGESVLGLSHWSPWLDEVGPVFGTSGDFCRLFRTAYGRQPDQIEAGSAAAGSVFQQAVQHAGLIPPLSADAKRVLKSLLWELSFSTFFGEIAFSASMSPVRK